MPVRPFPSSFSLCDRSADVSSSPSDWINAINYTQVCGIIIGQALVGVEGDWIGRKFGLCQDALIMLIGSILLTGVWSNNLNIWIIVYAWVLFVYGVGVGGEVNSLPSRIGCPSI